MSQHESVRLFIRDIVKSLRDDIQFTYSRQSDFNSIVDKNNVCVHLDPLRWNPVYVNDGFWYNSYPVALLVYKQGSPGDTEEQFVPMLDDTAEVAEKFLRKINRSGDDETDQVIKTDTIQISNVTVEPAIKVLSDVFTGWIVTFNLTVQDTFEYCSLYDS